MSDHIAEVSKKGDLISRQALLRQIDIDSDGEPGYYGDTWKFIDTIKMMPSAQPEYTEQDVRDSFNSGYACGMEAAQPKIIRCKDCKHYTSVTAHCEIRGKGLYLIRGMNDFCSRAERREDAEIY